MRITLSFPILIIFLLLSFFQSNLAFSASPQVGTITPASGSSNPNETVSFTTTYSDPDGWQNIQYVYLLVNTSTSSAYCFYGYYNQNTNRLYLRNDTGNGWLGGYTPGSVNVIENTYTKLHCASTTISGSGTTLTVNWNITFKPTFTGAKNTYLYVKDDANASNGWIQTGTWAIDNTPPTGSIVINNNAPYTNSTQVTLTLSAVDPESGVSEMQFSTPMTILTGQPRNHIIQQRRGLSLLGMDQKQHM